MHKSRMKKDGHEAGSDQSAKSKNFIETALRKSEKRHALALCNTWDPKLTQVLNPGSLSNFYVQFGLRSLHACCCSGVNIGY